MLLLTLDTINYSFFVSFMVKINFHIVLTRWVQPIKSLHKHPSNVLILTQHALLFSVEGALSSGSLHAHTTAYILSPCSLLPGLLVLVLPLSPFTHQRSLPSILRTLIKTTGALMAFLHLHLSEHLDCRRGGRWVLSLPSCTRSCDGPSQFIFVTNHQGCWYASKNTGTTFYKHKDIIFYFIKIKYILWTYFLCIVLWTF